MAVIVRQLCSCIKLTKWKTSTTHNNEMRQEDSNIKYRKKGENTVPKTQYQPKSSSQSQMHSLNVWNRNQWIALRGGIIFWLPKYSIQSEIAGKHLSQSDFLRRPRCFFWTALRLSSIFFILVCLFLVVLQTALWMAQYTGKTRTALCTAKSQELSPDCGSYLWLYIGSDLCPLVRIPIQTLHAQEHVPRVWEVKRTWRTWKGRM